MQEKIDVAVIQLTPSALQEALEKASTLGAMKAMQFCGMPIKELLSRAELSRKIGRGKVDRLISDGKLIPCKTEDGRPKYKLSEVLTLFN